MLLTVATLSNTSKICSSVGRGPFLASPGKSVSKNIDVFTPETPCMKGTSVHFKNMCTE